MWRYASGRERGIAVPGARDHGDQEMWAPELGAAFTRTLALAERDLRIARRELEQAGAHRERLVRTAAERGMSLRQIADCLDVTRGRVQQLLRSPPLRE